MTINTIIIAGRTLPLFVTMGAFVYYKQLTGQDASTIEPTDIGQDALFLWAVAKAACVAQNVPFDMTPDEFVCNMTPDVYAAARAIIAAQTKEADSADKKKVSQ